MNAKVANKNPNIFGLQVATFFCMYPAISFQYTPRMNKRKPVSSAILKISIGSPPNYLFGLTLNNNPKAKYISLNSTWKTDVTLRRNHGNDQDGA